QFKVKPWPKEDYGKFFSGDSYIVLNTYKNEGEDELKYDVHFWIGKESTQDEYGTAAYKTVELDTYLNDAPIQHREVQGHESELFKSYFKTITIMNGGAQTGFRHVQPEKYKPRLLHFSGQKKNIVVREVPLSKKQIKSDDVYILDLGTTIYQWNGSGSNKDERFKSSVGRFKHPFFKALTAENDDDDNEDEVDSQDTTVELFRLSDASGKLTFKVEKKGTVSQRDLDSKDVFILDTKKSLFVWVGNGTSHGEKKNALQYAHEYLMKTSHPFIPVTCLKEGQKNQEFQAAIAA
ncbi:unnamed protein product, partial [Candidula unifasciata]